MTVERKTTYGNIVVTEEAVAALAGNAICECYGVVGMASRKRLKDGLAELLKKDNYSKGIVVRRREDGLELDVYIIVSYGVRISEIVVEAQKKLEYVLEKTLGEEIAAVNVFVQAVQVVE